MRPPRCGERCSRSWRAATTASERCRPFREATADGVTFLCADLERDGGTDRLATAFVELDEAGAATRALGRLAADAGEGVLLVADFYAATPSPPRRATTQRAPAGDDRGRRGLPPHVERVVFAVAEPARGRGMSAVDFATFAAPRAASPRTRPYAACTR